METESIQYVLNRKEWLAIYSFLKDKELEISEDLYALVLKMEKKLYSTLTIEEIESIKSK